MTTISPIFYKTMETQGYIDVLANNIKKTVGKDADLLLDHPAIYVHVWQSKNDTLNSQFSIYIGETNDIVQRTTEHWSNALVQIKKNLRGAGNWQRHMVEDKDINGKKVIPTVYFFGHKLFHKSLTLDIENRLIDFCYAMPTAHVYNGRTNPQGNYSGDEDLDDIFSMIWKILRKDNPDLFLPESLIQKSAIFKASPNHRLTEEQKNAKATIIDRTVNAILSDQKEQLVFVEGDAGTGKTVLTSSTFYEILENEVLKELSVKSCLLVNHEEQMSVYKNIARKLGYDEERVLHPTTFLLHNSILDKETNSFVPNPDSMMDIVFVDEAHLLWHQRNQKYDTRFKESQLDEIMKRSRVTVIMYDENQVLHKGQVSSYAYMDKKRKLAKSQGPDPANGKSNYIELTNQLRMNCSVDTMNWIDSITKTLEVNPLTLNKKSLDSKNYEIRIFDDPASLQQEILKKASHEDTRLSRMVADFEWEYLNGSRRTNGYYQIPWIVDIGDWYAPWNEEVYHLEVEPYLSTREKKKYQMLDWAEKDTSKNEVGSTFTIQGFDLSYVGVILGPSIKYDVASKKIWFDCHNKRYFRPYYMTGKRVLDDGTTLDVTELIYQHELRVLLTRGTKGLYIYACDDDLRNALKQSITKNSN